jgi:hypothetical protein
LPGLAFPKSTGGKNTTDRDGGQEKAKKLHDVCGVDASKSASVNESCGDGWVKKETGTGKKVGKKSIEEIYQTDQRR